MLVRRMPEERGCLADSRLAEPVDWISGDAQKGECLRVWSVGRSLTGLGLGVFGCRWLRGSGTAGVCQCKPSDTWVSGMGRLLIVHLHEAYANRGGRER